MLVPWSQEFKHTWKVYFSFKHFTPFLKGSSSNGLAWDDLSLLCPLILATGTGGNEVEVAYMDTHLSISRCFECAISTTGDISMYIVLTPYLTLKLLQ